MDVVCQNPAVLELASDPASPADLLAIRDPAVIVLRSNFDRPRGSAQSTCQMFAAGRAAGSRGAPLRFRTRETAWRYPFDVTGFDGQRRDVALEGDVYGGHGQYYVVSPASRRGDRLLGRLFTAGGLNDGLNVCQFYPSRRQAGRRGNVLLGRTLAGTAAAHKTSHDLLVAQTEPPYRTHLPTKIDVNLPTNPIGAGNVHAVSPIDLSWMPEAGFAQPGAYGNNAGDVLQPVGLPWNRQSRYTMQLWRYWQVPVHPPWVDPPRRDRVFDYNYFFPVDPNNRKVEWNTLEQMIYAYAAADGSPAFVNQISPFGVSIQGGEWFWADNLKGYWNSCFLTVPTGVAQWVGLYALNVRHAAQVLPWYWDTFYWVCCPHIAYDPVSLEDYSMPPDLFLTTDLAMETLEATGQPLRVDNENRCYWHGSGELPAGYPAYYEVHSEMLRLSWVDANGVVHGRNRAVRAIVAPADDGKAVSRLTDIGAEPGTYYTS